MTNNQLIPNYNTNIIPAGSFTWREYAVLKGFHELAIPTPSQYQNAMFLFTQLQKLIRTPLGKPIDIASGARTAEYTRWLQKCGIPAANKSAHNDWQAVDLHVPKGMSLTEFWTFCDSRWPGRMEQWQFTPTWVHLDIRNWGERIRFKP